MIISLSLSFFALCLAIYPTLSMSQQPAPVRAAMQEVRDVPENLKSVNPFPGCTTTPPAGCPPSVPMANMCDERLARGTACDQTNPQAQLGRKLDDNAK